MIATMAGQQVDQYNEQKQMQKDVQQKAEEIMIQEIDSVSCECGLYIPETYIEELEIIPDPIIGDSYNLQNLGCYELTAYTWTGNTMANGEWPYVGAVACNSIPLGTVIEIEGYGRFKVCDTGGMGNNVVDIYMNSYDECIQFGRRTANVYIVK